MHLLLREVPIEAQKPAKEQEGQKALTGPCSSHPPQRRLPYTSAVAVRGWSKHRTPWRLSEGSAVGYPVVLSTAWWTARIAAIMQWPWGHSSPRDQWSHVWDLHTQPVTSLTFPSCNVPTVMLCILWSLKQQGQVTMDCNLRDCEPSEPFKPLDFSSILSQR